ncbi:MAG: hypothetical protein C5B50_25610 [Verrucomicrobia bacterium]|nr:MAG: hypothetical protein C5B50_25610 [Verrucomicrobiota bacterium]
MSYDLTIAKDRGFSASTQFADLADFLRKAQDVKPNGDRGFLYEPSPKRHMEIDLEVVSDEGDNIEEAGTNYPEINCVRLHVPYSMLGNAPERDYFPLAFTIAERLGWTVHDDQSGEAISRQQVERDLANQKKPWWKFW